MNSPTRVFCVFFLPLVVAYGVTLKWVYDSWMLPESYYSHGPLLVVAAVIVLWSRRRDWGAVPAAGDARGWWLLGPGLLLHLCGGALMIDSLSAASMVIALAGATWLALGWPRLRRTLPVLFLFALAVPMPIFMTGRLAFELKEVAISASLVLNDFIGLETARHGADLFVRPHAQPLEVADACSGLRSLIALTTLGYCVAFFMGAQTGARRWILLLAAMPIAVLTNVVRISGICYIAESQGVLYASTTGHEILRWSAWIVAFVLLLTLDGILSRWRRGGTR